MDLGVAAGPIFISTGGGRRHAIGEQGVMHIQAGRKHLAQIVDVDPRIEQLELVCQRAAQEQADQAALAIVIRRRRWRAIRHAAADQAAPRASVAFAR